MGSYEYLKNLNNDSQPHFLVSYRGKEGNLRPDFQELSLISLCAGENWWGSGCYA